MVRQSLDCRHLDGFLTPASLNRRLGGGPATKVHPRAVQDPAVAPFDRDVGKQSPDRGPDLGHGPQGRPWFRCLGLWFRPDTSERSTVEQYKIQECGIEHPAEAVGGGVGWAKGALGEAGTARVE